jgi:hypothetical protein
MRRPKRAAASLGVDADSARGPEWRSRAPRRVFRAVTGPMLASESAFVHGEVKVDAAHCLEIPDHRARQPQIVPGAECRLLAELHDNPRIGMSALARRLNMSAPAVTERVQRLERAGVITGYRLEVDPPHSVYPSPRSPGSGPPPVNSANSRPGAVTSASHRMPPHHRRRLLPDQGVRSGRRTARDTTGPVLGLRPNCDLDRGQYPGEAATVTRRGLTTTLAAKPLAVKPLAVKPIAVKPLAVKH